MNPLSCDVLAFQATDEILRHRPAMTLEELIRRGRTQNDYLKFLSFRNALPLDWGMRAELDRKSAMTAQYRNSRTLAGFIAGRCGSSGAVIFPRPGRAAGADRFEDCPLAEEPARVVSFALDWLSWSPSPPARYGHVQFDIGARVLMEFADDEPISVSTPLRMVFRIKDSDSMRGYRRYFWKAVPLGPQPPAGIDGAAA